MKKILMSAAVLVMALASCQNEEIVSQADGKVSVKAVMGIESRTTVGEDGTVTWSKGDKMLVYGGKTQGVLTLEGQGGNDTGTFTGFVQGAVAELTTALYPAEMADVNGNITLSQITYPNSNSPMVATWGETLNFSHLAGLVRVSVTGLTETTNTLSLTGAGIAGTATLANGELTGFSKAKETITVIGIPAGDHVIDIPVFATKSGKEVSLDIKINGKSCPGNIKALLKVGAISKSEIPVINIDNGELIIDYIDRGDHYEVFTPKGLLKWGYMASKKKNDLGLKLMNNIALPALTISEDVDKDTYIFTEEIIKETDGMPSGSNWIPVCQDVKDYSDCYKGLINGENYSITGLYVNSTKDYTGFVGYMYNGGIVKDLTIENAKIVGTAKVGSIVGIAQHNSKVENVKVRNSVVWGTSSVGGIVGYNYSRNIKADGTVLGEELSYIINCSIDENSMIKASGLEVGGICGSNNGGAIINCVNKADVTGSQFVGGVAGMNREYNVGRDGYVIACGSTSDANIYATSQYAGGIVGYAFNDKNHENTVGYIIACYSLSNVNAEKYASIMVGCSNNGSIYSSWSAKGNLSNDAHYSKGGIFNKIASASFNVAAEINQDFVDEMNAAIDQYNTTSNVEVICEHKWQFVNGEWPILVK